MANLPLIFGSHLGNFEKLSDPLWLGWFDDNGRLIDDVCREDLRKAANSGAGATRLFKPTAELLVSPGLWDVSKYDPIVIEDTKKAIAHCREFNIQPWLTLWFNHSEPTPWKNNIQGLRDMYSSIPLSEALVEMWVRELGTDVYFEICCEPVYKGNGTSQSYMNPGSSSYWLAKMIEKLWLLGVPADHICYGAELIYEYIPATKNFKVNSTRDMFGQAAEVVRVDLKKLGWSLDKINKNLNLGLLAQHNCGRASEEMDGVFFPRGYDNQFCIDTWGKTNSSRMAMVSDDGLPQGKPYVSNPQPDGRWPRPTPEEEYVAAKNTIQYPSGKPWVIEVLGYKHNEEIYAQLEKVEQAVFEIFGQHSENYGKFPDPITPDECKIGEIKTSTCPDGSTIITHTCENGKWVETGNTCPVEPDQKCSCWYYLNIHDTMFGIPNFLKCITGKINKYCKEKK